MSVLLSKLKWEEQGLEPGRGGKDGRRVGEKEGTFQRHRSTVLPREMKFQAP